MKASLSHQESSQLIKSQHNTVMHYQYQHLSMMIDYLLLLTINQLSWIVTYHNFQSRKRLYIHKCLFVC